MGYFETSAVVEWIESPATEGTESEAMVAWCAGVEVKKARWTVVSARPLALLRGVGGVATGRRQESFLEKALANGGRMAVENDTAPCDSSESIQKLGDGEEQGRSRSRERGKYLNSIYGSRREESLLFFSLSL